MGFLESISPIFDLTLACAAVVSAILLVINAVLIYLYVHHTRKQADATIKLAEDSQEQTKATLKLAAGNKQQTEATLQLAKHAQEQAKLTDELVEISRKDFEPSVQIVFVEKEGLFIAGIKKKEVKTTEKGVLLSLNNEKLRVDANFINLSKGITDFWVEINEFTTLISTVVGNIHLNFNGAFISGGFPITLKPKEKINGFFVFDILTEDRYDISNSDIFRSSELDISYRIKYKNGNDEKFSESWAFPIKDVITLVNNEYLLIGEWNGVHRGYFENFPNKELG
jgi:hypothetical protein